MPKEGEAIRLNGAFHVSTTIMQFVVASAAESELGALYHNCQTEFVFVSPSPKWDICNLQPLSIVIMPQQWALQTILSNINVPDQWK
jgi:hypothetical protein